jgi:hypothetical protein
MYPSGGERLPQTIATRSELRSHVKATPRGLIADCATRSREDLALVFRMNVTQVACFHG